MLMGGRGAGGSHLLGIRVRLECYVPAVVVCKLDADHLGAVVVLKQRLHLLRVYGEKKIKDKKRVRRRLDRLLPLTCGVQGRLYLDGRRLGDFSEDDDAPLVIGTNFLALLVHLYHRRG